MNQISEQLIKKRALCNCLKSKSIMPKPTTQLTNDNKNSWKTWHWSIHRFPFPKQKMILTVNIELQWSLLFTGTVSEFHLISASIFRSDFLDLKVISCAILLNGEMTILGVDITTILSPLAYRLGTTIAGNGDSQIIFFKSFHVIRVITWGLS